MKRSTVQGQFELWLSRRWSLTILAFLVTEVLGDSDTSQGNTGTGSWGLVHLTEHQGDLGLAIELNDTGLLHFVVQIVTLTGTLADTSEHGVTTVGLGNVVLYPISALSKSNCAH